MSNNLPWCRKKSPYLHLLILVLFHICWIGAFNVAHDVFHSRSSLLLLPMAGKQPTTTKTTNEWKKRSKRWVLVVEDEESIRSFVGQYLFDSGYQVTLCADALSALQVTNNFTHFTAELQSRSRSSDITLVRFRYDDDDGGGGIHPPQKNAPDAIVTDIRMPGPIDGIGLLRAIRSSDILKSIPIILLTAKGRTEDRVAGYDHGADVYLPKPFDPDELVAILDNLIDRNQLLSGTMNDGNSRVSLQDLKQDVYEIKNLLKEKTNRISSADSNVSGLVVPTSYQVKSISLSMDEQTVLKHLCRGWTNKEIAQQLNYSVRRVEQHLTSMYRKTGCNNRTELVRWAFDTKMVDL